MAPAESALASGRVAEQVALALDLDGAFRERASGRVVRRVARALDLDGACRECAGGRAVGGRPVLSILMAPVESAPAAASPRGRPAP